MLYTFIFLFYVLPIYLFIFVIIFNGSVEVGMVGHKTQTFPIKTSHCCNI